MLLLVPAPDAAADPIAEAGPEQLQRWLEQYPEADADGDGQLTIDEARRYRDELHRRQARQRGDDTSFEHKFTFATMSDGVKIALAVAYPHGFDADPDRKWPTVFSTCGYTGATVPIPPGRFGNRCVTVNASVRGTGASGGTLDPWQERTWQDGHEIIEDWIVEQPWSNGRVGLVGHSWPGLMGFLTATTAPPSLKAVCVSGLIEDFYRGICYIGGVRNPGFPVDWLNSYYRPDGPFGSGAAAMHARGLTAAAYGQIVSSRPERDLREDMLWLLVHRPLDDPGWHRRALATHGPKIRAPILIMHAYQDEQTGPTGLWLWKHVPDDVPKRLVLSNGAHQVPAKLGSESTDWLQHWLLEEGENPIADREHRVQCYFETELAPSGDRVQLNEPLEAADFPLPQTQYVRLHLHGDGTLAEPPPGAGAAGVAYRVDRGPIDAANEFVAFAATIDEPMAVCGPLVLTLWAELSTLDADFFVLLADRGPDGELFGLQRGLLRASHRRLDEAKSDYAGKGDARMLIRPYHPHDEIEPVQPHRPYRYEIEIPPVGHVFRPGHELVVIISRPPEADPIGVTRHGGPSYRYESNQPPCGVRILVEAEHPSSLLLPVLPEVPPLAAEAVPLSRQAGLQLAEPYARK
jgi:hypothetical protein